ncbi:MAG: hypothetical protein CBARDCOR_4188 [uncultured Caballeronia sp.]|nr:MAG: hypothetical protein CBARDCOR_4188 [uncultured Caballeronia sp.]
MHDKNNSFMIIDSNPKLENNDKFISIAGFLYQNRLNTTIIIERNMGNGLFIVTNLGRVTLQMFTRDKIFDAP